MQSLQFLIDEISNGRKIHISILDLSGILDTPATKIDIKNVVHSTNYCDIAKSTPEGLEACIDCKMRANAKATQGKKVFGGHCIYGLYEVSVPVIYGDSVAAIVYVGHAVIDRNVSIERIHRTCKLTGVDPENLIHELRKCEHLDNPDELYRIGELISDYIIWAYEHAPKIKHDMHWLVYLMKRHADEKTDTSLSELAKTYLKNEKYLGRLFKREIGMSYSEYARERKLEAAKSMISQSNEKIIDIALECGFNTISYFNRAFYKKYGLSPTAYRAKKQGNKAADN